MMVASWDASEYVPWHSRWVRMLQRWCTLSMYVFSMPIESLAVTWSTIFELEHWIALLWLQTFIVHMHHLWQTAQRYHTVHYIPEWCWQVTSTMTHRVTRWRWSIACSATEADVGTGKRRVLELCWSGGMWVLRLWPWTMLSRNTDCKKDATRTRWPLVFPNKRNQRPICNVERRMYARYGLVFFESTLMAHGAKASVFATVRLQDHIQKNFFWGISSNVCIMLGWVKKMGRSLWTELELEEEKTERRRKMRKMTAPDFKGQTPLKKLIFISFHTMSGI